MQVFTDITVLIVTHEPQEADRLANQLRRSGYYIFLVRVDSEAGFAAALDPRYDVILADLATPEVDPHRLLQLEHERGLTTPLIVLADPEQEQRAIDCLRIGASDYLCKDRLGRLGVAVSRAVEGQTRDTQEEYQDLHRYQMVFEHTRDVILLVRVVDGQILDANRAAEQTYGYSRTELLERTILDLRAPQSHDAMVELLEQASAQGILFETVHRRWDGTCFPVEVSSTGSDLKGQRVNLSIIRDISERKKAEQEIHELAEFPEKNPNPVIRIDPQGTLLFANAASAAMLAALTGPVKGQFPETFQALVAEIIASGQSREIEIQAGETVYSILFHPIPGENYLHAYGRDITAQKLADRKLSHINRLYAVLSQISQMTPRAKTQQQLFQQACQVLVDDGQFRMVWIGMVDPENLEVKPIAWAGVEDGFLSRVNVSARMDPEGQGPTGRSVTERRLIVCNDTINDPKLNVWMDEMERMKYRSLAAFPLTVHGHILGSMTVLSEQTDIFDSREVELLEKVASVLSFGLDTLEQAAQREAAELKIHQQIEQLSALRAIDRSILSGMGLEQTLDVLLEKILHLLRVDAADILLYNPKNKTIHTASALGLAPSPLRNVVLTMGESHAGKVALEKTLEFIPDLGCIDDSLTEKIRAAGEKFTSYLALPLVAKGALKGVLQLFQVGSLNPEVEWLGFLQALADQAAIAIDNAQLYDEQVLANLRLVQAYDKTIEGWSRALDLRDHETEGHSQRVTEMTEKLARAMDIPEDEMIHVRWGALLHDIGKVGVPDMILLKPGPLTEEEWMVMRRHPAFAYELLDPIDFLRSALDIPYCHHERWDGSGYPWGLAGEDIPLVARIFAVVDSWDALLSDRPYRPGWKLERVLAYIREQSGKLFDPQVVDVFLSLVDQGQIFLVGSKVSGETALIIDSEQLKMILSGTKR
jgi:PAS domain S-box-containing protein